MTLYQKIPTVSARVHPLMIGAALGVILLSIISTAAIIGWLPAQNPASANADPALSASEPAAGFAKVSAPVAADAAQAPSQKAPRKAPARITNA